MEKIGIMFLLVTLLSCQKFDNESINKETIKEEIVGNDSDQHGCKGSAGYQWSELKQECVRLWESGIKLLPTDSEATSAAYIIFNGDSTKVELFEVLQNSKSVIMTKVNGKNKWTTSDKEDTFLIKTENKGIELWQNNMLKYSEE